jgi:hypothetical protein
VRGLFTWYWGLLIAKLTAIAGVMLALWTALHALWPEPEPFLKHRLEPFARDLGYTLAVMMLWLLAVGLIYLAILDQRYRCRTCVRRLRMPLTQGVWNRVLIGPPRTDYICPFGHGTLRVPELRLSEAPNEWEPIDDMWRELEELGAGKR